MLPFQTCSEATFLTSAFVSVFPILIALAMGAVNPIVLPQIELIGSLIAATLVAFYFFQWLRTKQTRINHFMDILLIVILSFTFESEN